VTIGVLQPGENDHLLFRRPWLDGPTALAAVIEESSDLALATIVALPVVRGPTQLAKTLMGIDVLSEGRLVVGVGPGSSARDYDAIGLPFDDRWRRFDEALQALVPCSRGIRPNSKACSTPREASASSRAQHSGPRRRSGSQAGAPRRGCGESPATGTAGSPPPTTRLPKRSARASAVSPTHFESSLGTRISLNRPAETLRSLSLPIVPGEVCAERLTAFADARAERVFLWPLRDEVAQLELFHERVAPLL
jgi:Luciferase-like monooxygenase